jgi:LmbE family N-acetylglucosaminyl deacetylase
MINLNLRRPADTPLRVLCLGAHSDDIEIGCGGTILSLIQRYSNVSVRWVVFGSTNEDRSQEARASAAAFLEGAFEKVVDVKKHRDGFFPFLGAAIKDEFESLKAFKPDLIFTHYRDDRHQDHRLVSDLTWNTFRNHMVLEYEIPKYDGDLGVPNLFVELDESICRRKIDILHESFQSQRQRQWFDAETFLAILRLRGMEANSATRYAEAFYSRKVVLS